jgi:hypothetical protein
MVCPSGARLGQFGSKGGQQEFFRDIESWHIESKQDRHLRLDGDTGWVRRLAQIVRKPDVHHRRVNCRSVLKS